jgi:hypothetical protein
MHEFREGLMTYLRWCSAVSLLACAPALIAATGAQAPDSGRANTGLIVGQVVDASSGKGIAGALVSLAVDGAGPPIPPAPVLVGALPPLAGGRVVIATSDGRFVFRDLAAGRYTIAARKPGYLSGGVGARHPGSSPQPVVLGDGEALGSLTALLWKYATITGTVLDEAGEPVVNVQVRAVRRNTSGGRRVFSGETSGTTDDRGMYRISMLTPGDYLVSVPSSQVSVPVSMLEPFRQSMGDETTRSPAFQALMDVGVSPMPPGGPTTLQVGAFARAVGRSAVPPPPIDRDVVFVYPTLFYPTATSTSQAAVVTVASGEERVGVDFQLKAVPTARVSGTVMGTEGPAGHIPLRLMQTDADDIAADLEVAATVSSSDGSFTFVAVPAGSYLLQALSVPRPTGPAGAPTMIQFASGGITMMSANPAPGAAPAVPTAPTLFANLPVAVGERSVSGVVVPLRQGVRLMGRVTFEGAGQKPTPEQMTNLAVLVDRVDGRSLPRVPPIRADRSGQFTSYGLPAGRYFLRAPAMMQGWTFKSAVFDGRDVSDVPLDVDATDIAGITVTFTMQPTRLSGVVQGERGSPDPDASVLVFPSVESAWSGATPSPRRMRLARTSTTGMYTLSGLPPGEYCVIAVPDEESADWQDAKALSALARTAERVLIGEGRQHTQDLRTYRRTR